MPSLEPGNLKLIHEKNTICVLKKNIIILICYYIVDKNGRLFDLVALINFCSCLLLVAPQVKKTSPANKIPRLLLWLGVCITIIAAVLGIYYTYTQQKTSTLLTQPEQTRTNNSTATKPTPPEKKKVKMKKTTKNSDITNKYDKEISKELRKVEKILEKGQFEEASAKFENLIGRYPKSPRSHFGLAQALDQLSEKRQSNQLLQKSIDAYGRVSDLPDCPVELKRRALLRMADRLSFFGRSKAASMILEKLSKILPYDTKILSDLGVQYLLSGRNNEAKAVFRKVNSCFSLNIIKCECWHIDVDH